MRTIAPDLLHMMTKDTDSHIIHVPDPTPPINNVFLLATPADMYWKLSWELTELGTAMSSDKNRFPRQAPAYHAFNCALTAWHMTDWVWQATDAEQRLWLSSKFQFALVKDDRKSLSRFYDSIASACPQLHVCRQIANGSKHMKLDRFDPDVQVQADWLRVVEPHGTLRPGDLMMDLRISVGSDQTTATHLFAKVFRFWEQLLSELGFVEGTRYVEGRPVDPLR
jgi:hypothetical protein